MSNSGYLSEKSQVLLKALVEQYISDGQPVASKKLADSASVSVSPATVRNIMSDLEELGYVSSPHTSAGRIPTALGYRLFVDTLIKVNAVDTYDLASLNKNFDPDMSSKELVESASGILSEFTRMAGLVTIPKRDQVTLRHVDFLSLEGNRVLVILVLDDHEVQNLHILLEPNICIAHLIPEYQNGGQKHLRPFSHHLKLLQSQNQPCC